MNKNYKITINPGSLSSNYWSEFFSSWELLKFLVRRNISVRYKETLVGVLWAFLKPALTIALFSVIFGRLAGFGISSDLPYALIVFTGFLPWLFFSSGVQGCSNSIISSKNIIAKVYFPRMLVPLASLATSLVDFFIAMFLYICLILIWGVLPNWHVVFLPVVMAVLMIFALGLGLFLAALNVAYRDVGQLVPFIFQIGFYISPVAFARAIIPEQWRLIYSLNPLVGIIDGFRWCLLGDRFDLYWPAICISLAATGISLYMGIRTFRRGEPYFMDRI